VAKMGGRFCPTKMTWHNHGSIIVKYMIWPRTCSIFVFINRFKNYDNYDNFISIQIITWKYLNLTEMITLINMFWSIKTDFKLKSLFLHCFYLCFKMYLVWEDVKLIIIFSVFLMILMCYVKKNLKKIS